MSTVEHDAATHRFVMQVDGYRAVLDYILTGDVMSITHTGVPQPIGGRGIAAELMRAAVGHAQEQRLTINPLCSYAVSFLRKHPQDAD